MAQLFLFLSARAPPSPRRPGVSRRQLVDFGLGVKFSNEDEKFREDVGSLYYVAPEVLGRNYTKVLFRLAPRFGEASFRWGLASFRYLVRSAPCITLTGSLDGATASRGGRGWWWKIC